MVRKSGWAGLAVAGLAVAAVASQTIQVLVGLEPDGKARLPTGVRLEGSTFVVDDPRMSVRVAALDAAGRRDFFAGLGLPDPFRDVLSEENYVFFRVRFENRHKEEDLSFSPVNTMFGNASALDEVRLYQTFYRDKAGQEKLAAAGRGLFVKTLILPPGTHIERLLVYQYDDPYPVRKIPLIFGGILLGREGMDLELPFRADFKKEKRR
ncbi:MAG: hypothetical protein AB1347_09560 [Acidobacteriota bacterium]